MLVYSKKIVQFAADLKKTIRQILSQEIGLKVTDRYFFYKSTYYPLQVVIYNHQKTLGYFDPEFCELGFHESLMNSLQLPNIIRHELAHYMTFIHFGAGVLHHGAEFKAFCLGMGWKEDVYQASVCLEKESPLQENSAIFRKVQKLMALAKSSNPHEAELAMIKSQQLLLKHNLEFYEEEEKVFLKRIMKQKKISAKMSAVAKILETFFVNIVFRRAENFVCLEILGSKVNLEVAEYVASVLDHELDHLWDQARKEHPSLKGMVAKNSFFRGIAKGYCHKIHAMNQEHGHALMVIEKALMEAKELVYPRLSKTKSSAKSCKNSAALGELMGQQLKINPAVKSPRKAIYALN